MTDDELKRHLQSTGKAFFVRCFRVHEQYACGQLSEKDWEAALELAGYSAKGLPWRKRIVPIFQQGRAKDALRCILDSRVPPSVKREARRLLGIG